MMMIETNLEIKRGKARTTSWPNIWGAKGSNGQLQ
jgi:hypothetical protein